MTMSERKVRMVDMPADLMAVSSLLSPKLPNVMRDDSKMASGKACGTKNKPMYQKNCAMTFHGQSFANEHVDIPPQELHHQHELTDEEGSGKQQSKLLGDE